MRKVGFVGRQYLGTGGRAVQCVGEPRGQQRRAAAGWTGEVVGVVSMKIEDADGLGLALPIAYANKLIPVPSTPEAATRWEELLARVAHEEEREIEHFKADVAQPVLFSVRKVEGIGLVALLLERFDSLPSREAPHGAPSG